MWGNCGPWSSACLAFNGMEGCFVQPSIPFYYYLYWWVYLICVGLVYSLFFFEKEDRTLFQISKCMRNTRRKEIGGQGNKTALPQYKKNLLLWQKHTEKEPAKLEKHSNQMLGPSREELMPRNCPKLYFLCTSFSFWSIKFLITYQKKSRTDMLCIILFFC